MLQFRDTYWIYNTVQQGFVIVLKYLSRSVHLDRASRMAYFLAHKSEPKKLQLPVYNMADQYPSQYIYRQMAQAKLFIDKNFAEHLHLDLIADKAHFSKFHFCRLFKNTYGKTPNQYLTAVRIEKAKELLQTGLSITTVCISVGFGSISTFKGLFKRQTSFTPAVYKKSQSALKLSMKNTPHKFIPPCFQKI